MTKSREELDALKHDWCGDPNWDIEDTKGFEDHRAELRQYRREMEAKWKARREKEQAERMTLQYNLEQAVLTRAEGWCQKSLCYSQIAVAIALDALAKQGEPQTQTSIDLQLDKEFIKNFVEDNPSITIEEDKE